MTATPPAGAVDLKTYDVPDPPKQRGWKLRCLLSAAPGLLLALGLIRIVRLPHLVWVAGHEKYSWNDGSLSYAQECAIRWLREGYDADTLRPQVLGIEDAKVRGAFYEALAGAHDPAQIDAVMAYLHAAGYQVDEEAPKAVESMLAIDPARTATALMACYEAPAEGYDAERFRDAILKALDTQVPPKELLPAVLKITDPVKRGRFHAALATTKDPAQIDAVLAYARTVVPTDPGSSRPGEWDPIVKSLGEFGPGATPKLQAALEQTESRSLVSLAAEALRTSDLPFLVRRARALLDEYDAGVPQLAQAAHLVSTVDDGEETSAPAERVAAARELLGKASAKAYMIFEVLRALEPVKDDQAVDFCIVRGLSSFDAEIAKWSVEKIKQRFTPDKVIDTLFSYIAQKTEFAVSEVDIYEGLMKELGADGATRVAQNLDRLIKESGGDPDEVFWLYKKMGFVLLHDLGAQDAIPTLRKYARDPGSYVHTLTRTDGSGRRTREQQEVKYADQVKDAIAAIQARAGDADVEHLDPFVLVAGLLYLAAAGGLGLLVTGARIVSRGGAWDHLRLALAHAKKMGGATFAPLAGGKHGEFLVLAKGKHGAKIPGAKDLAPITRVALVKDKDGQTGLVVTAGADTVCVTGLEPMTRAWAHLQQEEVPVEVVFRDDEGQRIANKVHSLLPREQEMLSKWLMPQELLTDVIRGVDYEGAVSAPGGKGGATLLVTSLRVGLLARTILVERFGNTTRTTTSLTLIMYALPLATRVTMERAPSLGVEQYRLRLELPPEHQPQDPKQKVPVLKLGPDHTGLFLPLVMFRRPTQVQDAGASFGRVVLEAIGPSLGCGILLAAAAGIVTGVYSVQNSTDYTERYVPVAILCALLTPAIFKVLHLVEVWFERTRACAAV